MLVPLAMVLDQQPVRHLQGDLQVHLVHHCYLLHLTYYLVLGHLQLHQEVRISRLTRAQVLVPEPELIMLRLIRL